MSSIEGFKGEWSFLSNFYPCEIQCDGLIYKSVEAFYVAMKFNNDQIFNGKHYSVGDFREMISLTPSPGLVKKIGQKIIIRSDWDVRKLGFTGGEPTLNYNEFSKVLTGSYEILGKDTKVKAQTYHAYESAFIKYYEQNYNEKPILCCNSDPDY